MTNGYETSPCNAAHGLVNTQEELLLVRYLSACRCHCIRTAAIYLQRLAALREQMHGVPRSDTYAEYLAQADERERKSVTELLIQRHEC